MSYSPSSLIEAVRYFSDRKVCNEYMRGIKWPGSEMVCHHCGSTGVYELSTRPVLKCRPAPDAVCDCPGKAPTYPDFRDNPHLPGCRFYVEGAKR